MVITRCSKADFDQILHDIVDFWGSDRTLHLHHPTCLYEFGNTAYVSKEEGCTELKAITTPTNYASIAFHQGLGMELLGKPNEEGIPVVQDYSGPGLHRVVFSKRL